jgi:hypothetical protein
VAAILEKMADPSIKPTPFVVDGGRRDDEEQPRMRRALRAQTKQTYHRSTYANLAFTSKNQQLFRTPGVNKASGN